MNRVIARALGGLVLSLMVTSADAVIMLTPIGGGTGTNVQFGDQPPNQSGTTIFGQSE